jgi:hypothetical protein
MRLDPRLPLLLLAAAACSRDLALPDKALPVAFSPAYLSAAPWEEVDLAVAGGRAPYRFQFAEGGQNSGAAALVDPVTGRYTAGHEGPAIDFVEVVDAAGARATARIAVGAPFTLSPTTAFVAPGGSVALVPMGGALPYTIELAPGSPGSVVGGTYVAPEQLDCMALSAPPDTATLTVHDATAAPGVTVTITIGRGLDIFPAAGDASVAPAESLSLVASGGQPPYEFSMVTDGSGGPGVDAGRGTYTAGLLGNTTDRLAVTDANGQVRCIDVQVGPALDAYLSTAEVRPTVPLRIVATGGRPPYAFTFAQKGNRSRAALDPITGDYTPGPNAGTTDLVYVRDATDAPPLGPIAIDVGQLVLPTGNATWCLTADLSGDGRADYVGLSRYTPMQLTTAIAQSGGAPRVVEYPLTSQPWGIAAADVNGTGHASVALLTAAELRFLVANLDGTLQVGPQGADFGASPPTGQRLLAYGAGLVNGATTHRFAYTAAYPASGLTVVDWVDGAQAPSAPAWMNTTSGVAALEVLDWNGDTYPDLAYVTSSSSNTVRILPGTSTGVFGPEVAIPLADANYRMSIAMPMRRARMWGASADDLVLLAYPLTATTDRAFFRIPAGASVSEGPFTATVDGTWAPAAFAVFQPVPGSDPELVAVTRYSSSVAFHQYPIAASPAPRLPFEPRSFGPRCAATGDMDGDRVPDLFLSGTATQTEVLLGDADGLFGRRRHFFTGTESVEVADMDGDQSGDVVVATVDLALEVQFGTEGQLAVSEPTPTGTSERVLRLVDLDGDGLRDVFFVTLDGGMLAFRQLPGEGGRLGAPQPIDLQTAAGGVDADFYLAWRPAELEGAAAGPDFIAHSTGSGPSVLAAIVRTGPASAVSHPLPTLPAVSFGSEINADTRSPFLTLDLDGDGRSDALLSGFPNTGPVYASRAGGAYAGAAAWEFGSWTPVGSGFIAAAGETLYATPIRVGVLPTGVGRKQRALLAARVNTPGGNLPFLVNVTESSVTKVALSAATWTPTFGELGDLNGDGEADLAIQDADYVVHLYLADGSGWTSAPVEARTFAAPGKLWGVLAAPAGRGGLLFRTPDAVVIVSNAELFPP